MRTNVRRGFLITGRVQRSGFRPFLKDLAHKHDLSGFAENLSNRTEDVLIVCEGSEEKIKCFQEDLENEVTKQKDALKKIIETKEELAKATKDLDNQITAKPQGEMTQKEKDDVIFTLTKRKTLLRRHVLLERMVKPYEINLIKPLTQKEILAYKKNISKASFGDFFKIVRNPGESDDRLDEGISFLAEMRAGVSPYQYEVIDTDFAILDMKYGKLTDTIADEFPRKFAQAFEEILSTKYGMKPERSSKKN